MSRGEKRAIDAVLDAVEPLALPVERRRTSRGSILVLRTGEPAYRLVPLWAGEGFPEDVRRALDRFEQDAPRRGEIPVLAARRMSQGGRRAAEERNAGWVDETRQARIVAPPALAIMREPAPAPASRVPATSGWSASSRAVAELLLTLRVRDPEGDNVPSVAAVAAWLDWSVGQVAKVLGFFDREGWTVKHGGERGPTAVRTLADPSGLLSAWAAAHGQRPDSVRGFGAHFRDPLEFVAAAIAPHLPDRTWCVTGWAALDVLAPFTTTLPTLDVYVDADSFADSVRTVVNGLDLRPVETGARLNFVRAPRHVVTLANADGAVPVASPVRVYGDLLRLGARGENAAHRLRETVLGY